MPLSLKNKTIVVTRAIHQANCLITALEKEQARVILFPTLSIQAAGDATHRKKQFQALTADDMVIVVSANAVTDDVKDAAPFISKASVLAVGSATQSVLESAGISVQQVPEIFSSEGLLSLPILSEVAHKNILILCGENSRPFLRETLFKRNARVEEVICYRVDMPAVIHADKRACQSQKIDVIIATSAQGLLNLYRIFEHEKEWLFNQRLCVISEKMKKQAIALGFIQEPIVAKNAMKESIVEALKRE